MKTEIEIIQNLCSIICTQQEEIEKLKKEISGYEETNEHLILLNRSYYLDLTNKSKIISELNRKLEKGE